MAYLNHNKKLYSKEDDIDSMWGNFEKSNEIWFTTLSNVQKDEFSDDPNFSDDNDNTSETSVTVSTTKDKDGNIVDFLVSRTSSIREIEPLAKSERREQGLSPDYILFISIAWTLLLWLQLFMLCPEVMWAVVMSHSNKKGFDLLTSSCHTSVGKQMIF